MHELIHDIWERTRYLYEKGGGMPRGSPPEEPDEDDFLEMTPWDLVEYDYSGSRFDSGSIDGGELNAELDAFNKFLIDVEALASVCKLDTEKYYDLLWIELYINGYHHISGTEGFFATGQWNIPRLSYEQINEIAIDAQMGDEDAKELLCIYCSRMVRKVVNSFRWAFGRGLEMMDLYQSGMLGLLIALEKWDYEYEVDFMGWSKWRIYAEITRTITNEGPLVRLPRDWQLLRGKIPKIREELEAELGGKASYEEMAHYIFLNDYYPRPVAPQRVEFLENYREYSSNRVISDDEGNEIEEQDLYEATGLDPADVVANNELVETLFECLTAEEQLIVTHAAEGMGRMTFKEIAEELLEHNHVTGKPLRSESVANKFHNAIFKMKGSALALGIDKEMALQGTDVKE